MAGTINTQAQLQVSSSATYTTNAANLITAGLVRTFNENWISSSLLIPMTASMTVLSSSYAYTASSATNAGSSISASYAFTASYVNPLRQNLIVTGSILNDGIIVSSDGAQKISLYSSLSTLYVEKGDGNFIALAGQGTTVGETWPGPLIFTNNASTGNTSAIGFDPKATYTDGRVTFFTPLIASSSIIARNGVTGSLQGTASYALTATSASFAVSASYANSFLISGSLIVTGSAVTQLIPITVASNTASIDCRSGNLFSFTLGAASTTHIAFSNIKEGQTGNLLITTAATSTASFSSNVKQISGSQYTATSGSGQTDLLSFATVGSSVYVVNSKKFV